MAFKDKVAVVTGASSGIGWHVALELAKQGAKLGLIARRREKLDELATLIRASGGVAAVATADVANRQETLSAFNQISEQLGPTDLLVANAGVGAPTLLNPMNIEQIERMLHVNLFGVIYSIEAVLPRMLERRQGHISAVSSLASFKGLPGESAYCASKAAVNTYLEGLRIQLRAHNIAVTTLCPGFVHTPMTEPFEFYMPCVMSADKAARKMVSALRRKKKVYRFPLPVVMLMKLTQWLPDWILARSMAHFTNEPPAASAM